MTPIPPAPEGWNLTMDDLAAEMKAGKRKSMGSPEVEWAIQYERSLLPADMRYPQKGDVYEARAPVTLYYMTSWRTPYTGDGKGTLESGDRITIPDTPDQPEPISVYATAVDYRALEKRLVPFLVRYNPLYRDFYFSVDSLELHQKFRLVPPAAK